MYMYNNAENTVMYFNCVYIYVYVFMHMYIYICMCVYIYSFTKFRETLVLTTVLSSLITGGRIIFIVVF